MATDTTKLIEPIIALFGDASQPAVQQIVQMDSCDTSLCGMIDYKLLVLLCLCCYSALYYYFKGYIQALINMPFRSSRFDKLMEEQGFLFSAFLRALYGTGIVAWSIFVVKVVDITVGADVVALMPQWGLYILALGVIVVCLLIGAYRFLMLRFVGGIGSVFAIAFPLTRLSSLVFGLGTIVATPVIILTALSSGIVQEIGLYIVALGALSAVIFHLYKSYLLFIEQNVSIFYWFLYLCSVEVFPVSFFALALVKNIA